MSKPREKQDESTDVQPTQAPVAKPAADEVARRVGTMLILAGKPTSIPRVE